MSLKLNLVVATLLICSLTYINLAFAEKNKFYDYVETGKCSSVVAGKSNSKRMKQNAVNHAKGFCSNSGGVATGKRSSDFVAATEGPSPYFCRVKGFIECKK